jgi:antitoxin ParD1/3/4
MVNVVEAEVEAATVASPSEVLREAMRVWVRREEEHKERVAAIRAQVQASLDDPRPSLNSREMRTAINAGNERHSVVRSSQSSFLFAKPVKFALRPSAIWNVLTTVANVSATRHFGVVALAPICGRRFLREAS